MHFVEFLEENKSDLSQLEDVDEVDLFQNFTINKRFEFLTLLVHIERYNPHKDDESFKNKIEEIRRDFDQQDNELDDLIEAKKIELHKGLSPERIEQFLQFEADESHVGDQCQVCLEELKWEN